MRFRLVSLATITVVCSSCGDGPTAPTTGALAVSVVTTGSEPDEDGYRVSVDGEHDRSLDANATVVFADLPAGPHSAALSGVAANCTIQEEDGPNPRPVTVSAGDTAAVAFEIRCPATGPGTLAAVLGERQRGTVGQTLGLPFLVQVTDAQGAGVPGIPVQWTVTSGDGALDDVWEDCSPFNDERGDPLTAASVMTNLGGFAAVTFVPAGFGPSTVTAGVGGLLGSPVTFIADATDSSAMLSPEYPFDRQDVVEVIAGPQRQLDMGMRVTDAAGNGAPGVAVTWSVASGTGELRNVFGCDHERSTTEIITRTAPWAGAQVAFQPTTVGIITVTATVSGLRDSTLTFTLDATHYEIRVTTSATGEPQFLGPDYSADAIVPVAATVEWWNTNDSAQIASVTAPVGGDPFDSGMLSDGERFQFVPPVAGTWEYIDQVSGVTGTLTAEDP